MARISSDWTETERLAAIARVISEIKVNQHGGRDLQTFFDRLDVIQFLSIMSAGFLEANRRKIEQVLDECPELSAEDKQSHKIKVIKPGVRGKERLDRITDEHE